MSDFKEEYLSGWGNIPMVRGKVSYAHEDRDVSHALKNGSFIPRGKGRSYADQATNNGDLVLKMEKMNMFISFDSDTGILTAQAGVTLEEIIRVFAPRGWFTMINPGTKYVTLGGAIANDIHGKAHHADGSFVNSVIKFTIMLANGRVLTASREENEDLFWANFGGLGLLGTILTVTLRLRKVETTYFSQKSIVARNLEEMMDALDETEQTYRHSVAWIDSLAKGKNLGRGVLTVGNEARFVELPPKLQKDPLAVGAKPKITVPVYLPSFTLNKLTISVLNSVLHFLQSHGKPFTHYDSFLFPLDAINEWNKGYGKRGFIQYQFVVPEEDGRESVRRIMKEITESDCKPFLNVLKKFGEASGGPLSFPMKGYTFAIDFPITDQLEPFTKRLDEMVLDAGGRIYLGKDAFLDMDMFRKMYPNYGEWMKVKQKYDPDWHFNSDIGRRLLHPVNIPASNTGVESAI